MLFPLRVSKSFVSRTFSTRRFNNKVEFSRTTYNDEDYGDLGVNIPNSYDDYQEVDLPEVGISDFGGLT